MVAIANYRLDVYDTDGVLQAALTDFQWLSYTKRVNHPGVIQFGLNGDHALLSTLADKWQVEVWRKPAGGSWGREITGLFRMLTYTYSESANVSVFCQGLMSILDWRIVAYTAGYTDRSSFSSAKAETVANTLVKYNAEAAITMTGRERNGSITGLSVETDGAEGNTIDWNCAWDNLLETLQKLAMIGGGDFDLVKTSSTTWQWRWYTGQLGTDRSSSVTFALNYGNMANPVYIANHTAEKTVAIVGGPGEREARSIVVRTGTDYVETDHDFEMFVSASDLATTAALNSRGDQKLAQVEATKEFRFTALQTDACKYGTHYVLGDLVTAVNPFVSTTYVVKVDAVMVTLKNNGDEMIDIEMSEPL